MKHATILLLLAVSACASAPANPPASEAEKNRATDALVRCFVESAARLDDGVSDANTVAQGIAVTCGAERENVVEVRGRGMNPHTQQLIAERFRAQFRETALQVVLERRANRPH
jgi:hypothetical protein